MKAFLDTSVLVPAFYENHIHHQASFAVLADLDPQSGCCGAHSLVEVFATLTRMPGKDRVSGEQAMLFVSDVRDRLRPVPLTSDEHGDCLARSADRGIVGGATYDALLAHCALKIGAETIYTWNLRHYVQCGPEVTERLRTP